jgi:hypothetical protein
MDEPLVDRTDSGVGHPYGSLLACCRDSGPTSPKCLTCAPSLSDAAVYWSRRLDRPGPVASMADARAIRGSVARIASLAIGGVAVGAEVPIFVAGHKAQVSGPGRLHSG